MEGQGEPDVVACDEVRTKSGTGKRCYLERHLAQGIGGAILLRWYERWQQGGEGWREKRANNTEDDREDKDRLDGDLAPDNQCRKEHRDTSAKNVGGKEDAA